MGVSLSSFSCPSNNSRYNSLTVTEVIGLNIIISFWLIFVSAYICYHSSSNSISGSSSLKHNLPAVYSSLFAIVHESYKLDIKINNVF